MACVWLSTGMKAWGEKCGLGWLQSLTHPNTISPAAVSAQSWKQTHFVEYKSRILALPQKREKCSSFFGGASLKLIILVVTFYKTIVNLYNSDWTLLNLSPNFGYIFCNGERILWRILWCFLCCFPTWSTFPALSLMHVDGLLNTLTNSSFCAHCAGSMSKEKEAGLVFSSLHSLSF